MTMTTRYYSPDMDPDTGGEDILNPKAEAELSHDLYDDETAYEERGEIRKGIFEEDDRHESSPTTDTQAGDNENVTPGA